MATSDKPYDTGNSRVPRRKLETAMAEVANVRLEYIRAQGTVDGPSEELLQAFHNAVVNYFLELRVYRNEDVLGDKWANAKLWPAATNPDGTAEEWVRGLDTLYNWIGARQTVEKERPGDNRGTETVTVPKHLNKHQLLRVSNILDEIARDLGIAIDTDQGPRPAYLLDEREPKRGTDNEEGDDGA